MEKIIISRTDKIGDVILTLPMIYIVKNYFPESKIVFLANKYTRPIIDCASDLIEEVIEWDKLLKLTENQRISVFKNINANAIIHVFPDKEIAKTAYKASIENRIGTSHRIYNLKYCNKLVNFSRKNSNLHEAQLNLKLLRPFKIDPSISYSDLCEMQIFKNIPQIEERILSSFIDEERINLIFHPHSKGSAREWPIEFFTQLSNKLPQSKYNIIFSGTEVEAKMYRPFIKDINREVKDAGGLLSLEQYISLIANSQGLLAASTGPLHIAAAIGIHAFGIFPPIKPMHPGRWSPIGKKVHIFVKDKECSECRNTNFCNCMASITPEDIEKSIKSVF